MSDGSKTKTKAQLLAEIKALRKQLAAGDNGKPATEESSAPSFSRPITRREALTNWIAPVILSVPVVAAMRSAPAQAQGVPSTSFPTQFPSPSPAPTVHPTAAPTVSPTPAPTTAPTAAPTVSPTGTPEPEAVPGLGIAGIAVLGGALAVAGAKLLKDRADASDAGAPEDDSKAD
jgi:hypothetical protein